jgi:hypothetical protein
VRWFDSAFDFDEESLYFVASDFRGTWQDRMLFTSKPIEKMAEKG